MLNKITLTTIRKMLFIIFLIFYSKISFAENSLPTVQLKYAYLFDPVCASKNSYQIDPKLIKELNNQIPVWQNSWNQEGSLLLKTAMKIIGKPFPQNHYTVPLSICNFPSMSEPLMVNVRYSLSSFTQNPIDINVTISTIEHEILHTYIDSFFPKNTPLLNKYHNESQTVLNHLHLFALQKATYLLLGQDKILKDVIAKDSNLPNSEYKRAWEIINKEGYVQFINELKSANGQQK